MIERKDNDINISKHPFMKFHGKRVVILCLNDFMYNAARLEVYPEQKLVYFIDKFNNETIISFSQIKSITEVTQ